ncbi:MAG: ParB/RepB/Spo0J family partition protein [Planctomycetota bacterium]
MSKERRLGRGLEALLGRAGLDQSPENQAAPIPVTYGSAAVATQPGSGGSAARLMLHAPEELEQAAASLPTNEIFEGLVDPNPWQPRSAVNDDELIELANSLREHGLVQPIVVRARGERYQLIAGQRRLAAARRLGWGKVLVRVLDVDDRQMAEIAIVENLQRRDLDALEKAASFRQYISTWQCTQEELAKRLSIDRSTVANLIRLLELPEAVQQKLRAGAISMGHARALLPLGDEDQQTRLADRVLAEGLSVRAIEAAVQEILRGDEDEPGDFSSSHTNGEQNQPSGDGSLEMASGVSTSETGPKRGATRASARRSSQIVAVENQLRRALGTKVIVHATSKGSGRIVIPFADTAEFQRLLKQMS